MLIACRDCERQYDFGDLAPGSKLLCRCGLYLRVPSVTVRDAVVTRCPSCGAALASGASECAFCGSGISSLELSLGDACPKCLCRMFRGAKYCSTCGLPIRAERLHPPRDLGACPRCGTRTLLERPAEGVTLAECSRCSGIWLPEEFFDRVVREKDEAALGVFASGRADPERSPANPDADAVRYLACPACGERMHRRNFGSASGVIIDWCRTHGYWFDTFELERVFSFVRDGGLDRERRRQIDGMEEEIRRARTRRRAAEAAAPPGLFLPGSDEPDGGLPLGEMLEDALGGIVRGLRKLIRGL